ncbi:hypothetical protein QVD17_15814 [Tagetes erecta]|uniref:Uncharacterized protein n=1 Tax=Tagetes erecta TaxID=13708 RepID=A0AAD8KTZ8_TARER|nr:hypothetical protein QVD17_15814 [Tagetes erecta]
MLPVLYIKSYTINVSVHSKLISASVIYRRFSFPPNSFYSRLSSPHFFSPLHLLHSSALLFYWLLTYSFVFAVKSYLH